MADEIKTFPDFLKDFLSRKWENHSEEQLKEIIEDGAAKFNVELQKGEVGEVIATYRAKRVEENLMGEVEEITLDDLRAIKLDSNERKLPDLAEILPPNHFINKVTRWMSGLSDTYYEYQVLAALWLLSDLIQGKGSLKLRMGEVKPNLYVMLLGQSTKSRKSTAVKKIKQIREIATDVDFYNDEPTIEGYLEMLEVNPIQSFVCDEASGLLSKFHKRYNEGIFDLECKIFDGESVRKIKASGQKNKFKEYVVKNPYVTHLYATTPDKFCSVMTQEDFLCGYGYRFLYAFPTYFKARMDVEVEDRENVEAFADVVASVKYLFKRYAETKHFNFTITQEALDLFNALGKDLEDEAEKKQDESLDSAVARIEDNILKVAMLLEIGKEEPSHEITEESIAIASVLALDFFLPSFMQMMDRLLSDVKNNKIEKAISVIRRMGGHCSRSTLIKNGHFTAKDCDEAIEAMVIGQIVEEKKVKETSTTVYILKTEAKALELSTTETSELFEGFRRIRTFRRVRKYTRDIQTCAKSAKSGKIIETDITIIKYPILQTGAMTVGSSMRNSETCEICETCEIQDIPDKESKEVKRDNDTFSPLPKFLRSDLCTFAKSKHNYIVEGLEVFVGNFLKEFPGYSKNPGHPAVLYNATRLKERGWKV